MDYWKTQYLSEHGGQASSSRVFIASHDQGYASGRVESSATSASVSCTLAGQLQDGDDLSVQGEEILVSVSRYCGRNITLQFDACVL